jgi:hypothetical protein
MFITQTTAGCCSMQCSQLAYHIQRDKQEYHQYKNPRLLYGKAKIYFQSTSIALFKDYIIGACWPFLTD